jgi:hypothetical protein
MELARHSSVTSHLKIACSSSSALWKVPRRIIRPVINAKKRSTWFNHELLGGVK